MNIAGKKAPYEIYLYGDRKVVITGYKAFMPPIIQLDDQPPLDDEGKPMERLHDPLPKVMPTLMITILFLDSLNYPTKEIDFLLFGPGVPENYNEFELIATGEIIELVEVTNQ